MCQTYHINCVYIGPETDVKCHFRPMLNPLFVVVDEDEDDETLTVSG
jgi:hypothetical protein